MKEKEKQKMKQKRGDKEQFREQQSFEYEYNQYDDNYEQNIHPYNRSYPIHELILTSELAQQPFEQTVKVNIASFYTIQSKFKQRDIWVRQYIEGSEWFIDKENYNMSKQQYQEQQKKILLNAGYRSTYHLLRASGPSSSLTWASNQQNSYQKKLIQFAFDISQIDSNQTHSQQQPKQESILTRLCQLQWSGPVSVQYIGEQCLLVPQKQRIKWPYQLFISVVNKKRTKGNLILLIPESENKEQKYVVSNRTSHIIQVKQALQKKVSSYNPEINVPPFNQACIYWADCTQLKQIEVNFLEQSQKYIYQLDQMKNYQPIEMKVLIEPVQKRQQQQIFGKGTKNGLQVISPVILEQNQQSKQKIQQNPPPKIHYTEIIYPKIFKYGDQCILDLSYKQEINIRMQQLKMNQLRIAQQRIKMKKKKDKQNDDIQNDLIMNFDSEQQQLMQRQSGLNINISIKQIGISVITQGSLDLQDPKLPEEILFLSIDQTNLLYSDTQYSTQIKGSLDQIQIDNQNLNALFPIVLGRGMKKGREIINLNGIREPLINITFITSKEMNEQLYLNENDLVGAFENGIEKKKQLKLQQIEKKKKIIHIVVASAIIQPLCLSFDEDLLFTILQFYYKEINPIFSLMTINSQQQSNDKINKNIIGQSQINSNQNTFHSNQILKNKQINNNEIVSGSIDDIIPSLRIAKIQSREYYRLNLINQQHINQQNEEFNDVKYNNYVKYNHKEKQLVSFNNANTYETELQGYNMFAELIFIQKLLILTNISINDISKIRSFGLLAPVLKTIASFLLNLRGGCIKLNSLFLNNISGLSNDIINNITTHYKSEIQREILYLLGSMELLGNPSNFISRYRSDILDINSGINKTHSTKQLINGLAKFGGTLVPTTIFGLVGSLGQISGAISSGLAQITQDEEEMKNQRIKNGSSPENIGQGIYQSVNSIAQSFVNISKGVTTKPIERLQKDGKTGFLKEFFKGVVGIVTVPLSGLFEVGKNVLIGIQNTGDNITDKTIDIISDNFGDNRENFEIIVQKRKRLPRYINSRCIIEEYDERKALGNLCLNQIKRKVSNEEYIAHIILNQNNSQQYLNLKQINSDMLLLTTHRVILIKYRPGQNTLQQFGIEVEIQWIIQLAQILQVHFSEKSAQRDAHGNSIFSNCLIELKYIEKTQNESYSSKIISSTDRDSLFAMRRAIELMRIVGERISKQNF